MEYSLRILRQDKVRLDWLLANDEGKDKEYTNFLERDIADLENSIKVLENDAEKPTCDNCGCQTTGEFELCKGCEEVNS